jgi:PAS domain S-box-containing protein
MPNRNNLRFLDAPGEVAALMRGQDWSLSPLGPPQGWPQSLRSVVSLMLRSKFPMFVAWGPSLGFLYNDSYAEILGTKHPAAIGRPFEEVWSEIWDDVGPLARRALAGEAIFLENLPLTMQRKGYEERTWFTFSYSPVVDEHGDVAGMYCACTETTESMTAEASRRDQMQRLRSLFEQAPGLFAVTRGREHVFEITNPAYLELVGRQGIVGLSVREALPELDQKFIDQLSEVFESGIPYIGRRIPVGLRRGPDAEMEDRIIDFVFQPIVDDSGKVDGILVQGTDITEQAVAERDAQTERRRLDAVIESLPSGVILVDRDGAITRVNAANRAIWGEHPSEGVAGYGEMHGTWADGSARHGQPVLPEDWALARALGGEVVTGDVVEIQPFGDAPRRTLLLQAMPIRLEDGKLTGAVVAQTDISDRIRAEAELRASEARFRTITDAMPQMVWSTLPDGYHDYFNRQWYDYTGLPEGETDGERWANVFHPDDQPNAWARWRHSLATGDDYEIQYRLRHRSGEYRWVLGRAVPVRSEDGAIIRWLGTCTVIHEQRLAQENLQRSERALREADRRKDEFLAMLAHELRNPLAPISTASQLLQMMPSEPARVRAVGEVIARNVRHMTELVDDLLDVSRVTRGLVQLEIETVNLKEVIGSAIEQARPIIDARRHALRTRLPATSLWVRGDRTRLTQVFTNLLNNAAKYTPEGGELDLDAEVMDTRVAVHVRDSGQGIEPALLPQIFELFTQAERSPDRSQGGLGIGLALVQSLLTLHGGQITARSEGRNLGATFTVELSLVEPPASSGTPISIQGDSRPSSLDIVVVDDNVDAAVTLQILMQALGHRVRVFHRALDALDAIVQHPPDVAFLDIGLPDITGYELAREIRERLGQRTILLAALSGYGQPQDIDASRAAGLDHHLVKPIDHTSLLKVLERVDKVS